MPFFYPPLLILGQKFISPWAYIRERFSGSEIQNLKNSLISPWAYMRGNRVCRNFLPVQLMYFYQITGRSSWKCWYLRPSKAILFWVWPMTDLGYVHITPFSFWSVFAPKNGAVFFSVHTTPFSDRNRYPSIGVHTISQKRICFSLSDNEAFKASNIGVFKLFRFWCSHYRVAFLFSSVFI